MANNLLQLSQFVQQGFDQGEAKGKANNLATLTARAAAGQMPDYQQIASNGGDPMAFKKQAIDSLGQAAQWFAQLPPDQQAQQYPSLAQHAQQLGFPVPAQFDPAFVPKIAQLASMISGQADPNKPMNVSPGGEIVDPSTGRVIHSNQNFAPQRPTWDSQRGGWVMPPDSGQPAPQAQPSNVQFDFAPGTPQAVIDATKAYAAADQGQSAPQGPGFIPVVPPRGPAPAAPAEFEKKAAYLRAHGVPEESITQMILGGSGSITGGATDGDPFGGLSPADAAVVKGLANYDILPQSLGRANNRADLIGRAKLINPDYSESTAQAAYTYKKNSAGSSPTSVGAQKNAVNTALHHLGTLMQVNAKLGDPTGFQFGNRVVNSVRGQTSPELTKWNQAKTFVSLEMAKLVAGGVATQEEVRNIMEPLSADGTQAQRNAAIAQATQFLYGRISALEKNRADLLGAATPKTSLMGTEAEKILAAGYKMGGNALPDLLPPSPDAGEAMRAQQGGKKELTYNPQTGQLE